MNVIDSLNWRYAVKKFSEQVVAEQDIDTLKEMIRLSPSSYGLQPYKVIVVHADEIKDALIPFSYGQEKVARCSHLFVFAADTSEPNEIVDRYMLAYAKNHSLDDASLATTADQMKTALSGMSDSERVQWAHQQAYLALGSLLIGAASMKIDACPMGGFDAAGYDRILGLESMSLTTSVICPIGYRHAEDRQAHRPKTRLDLKQLFVDRQAL